MIGAKTLRTGGLSGGCLEMIVFSVAAMGLFGWQVFWSNCPNLALFFDSMGYLSLADTLMKLCAPETGKLVLGYVLSGFSEAQRLNLAAMLSPASGVLASGPILPGLLALVYAMAGKTASPAHWQVGSCLLVFLQSMVVPMVWFCGREIGGVRLARLAALLALSYAPFAVNAGRILSEIPATFLSAASLVAIVSLLYTPLLSPASGMVRGLLTGMCFALFMLSRAPLIFLPWLALIEAVSMGRLVARDNLRAFGSWLIGLLIGTFVLLSPWMLFEEVLTGHRSPVVNRNGAYNLWVGTNLETDGWDALPSRYVNHPEQFTRTMHQVLDEVKAEISSQPLAFINLMVRKPGRMIDAPWNDFQMRCWGIPWLAQYLWHKALLLFAGVGAGLALVSAGSRSAAEEERTVAGTQISWSEYGKAQGRQEPTGSGYARVGDHGKFKVVSAVLLTFVAYHLLYCPFIAMSRYFITAMPAILLLSALGIDAVARLSRRQNLIFFWLSIALVCVVCEFADVHGWMSGELSQLAVHFGIVTTSTMVAVSMGLSIVLWSATSYAIAARRPSGVKLPAVDLCWMALTLLVVTGASIGAFHQAGFLERLLWLEAPTAGKQGRQPARNLAGRLPVLKERSSNAGRSGLRVLVPVALAPGLSAKLLSSLRWFVAVDARDWMPDPDVPALSTVRVSLNGVPVDGHLRPLLMVDGSQRESFMYLRHFAYGSGGDISRFRQWYVIEVPRSLVRQGATNAIVVSERTAECHRFGIGADYLSPGQPGKTLALRSFSWTKGFFANCPGEMRLQEVAAQTTADSKVGIRPRVRLLAVSGDCENRVRDNDGSLNSEADTGGKLIHLPDAVISPRSQDGRGQPLIRYTLDERALLGEGGRRLSVFIRVRGRVRSPDGDAQASACLLERVLSSKGEAVQFAPLAPSVLKATRQWREFEFEDLVPSSGIGSSGPSVTESSRTPKSGIGLAGLTLMLSGRPWWDVLMYSSYKTKQRVEFRDLSIELVAEPTLNLSDATVRQFPAAVTDSICGAQWPSCPGN